MTDYGMAYIRRPGAAFVADVDPNVERMEPIEHGAWGFLRLHMKDGTTRDIRPNGEPVVIRSNHG